MKKKNYGNRDHSVDTNEIINHIGKANEMVEDKKQIKLKNIVIIGKFDDGKCRQVLINHKTQNVVLSAIISCEQQIRVLETIIEGIDIDIKF